MFNLVSAADTATIVGATAPKVSGFEAFLNFAIPATLVVVCCAFIYFKFREPIGALILWLQQLFNLSKDKLSTNVEYTKQIVYDP